MAKTIEKKGQEERTASNQPRKATAKECLDRMKGRLDREAEAAKKKAQANPDKRRKTKPKREQPKTELAKPEREPRYRVDAAKLKKLREKAGLNPSQLYKKAGVRKDLAWHMEKKNRTATMAEVESIAGILGVKVDELGPEESEGR